MLCCVVLRRVALRWSDLHCTVFGCVVLLCVVLDGIVWCCVVSHGLALYCMVLYYIAIHDTRLICCIVLQLDRLVWGSVKSCCVVLCGAVLCCAVMCHGGLYHTML